MNAPRWPVALVTGASSGIGLEFARQLAGQGSDLVLVARSEDRLLALAEELEAAYPGTVEVLAADLREPAQRGKVEQRLADETHPVDLLVNNAGYGIAGKFGEHPVDDDEAMLELNVVALTRLTYAALGQMQARGRGGILNVSSVGGFVPSYGYATYGASKSYVTAFTEVLHEEVRGSGINVTCLAPGFTRTEFQQVSGNEAEGVPGFLWQSPAEVAAEGLAAVAANRAVWVPGRKNQAMIGAMRLVPRALQRRLSGTLVSRF